MPILSVRHALLGLCLAATIAVLVLLAGVHLLTGSASHDFLAWNILLGWVPFVFALAIDSLRRARLLALTPLCLGWLAFLPNAPYLVTDLIHVGEMNKALPLALAPRRGRLWDGAALRFRLPGAGARLAWTSVAATIVVTAFGIYLGRILRWNSWGVVSRPQHVLADVGERVVSPLEHPLMFAGVDGSYALFYALQQRALLMR